MKRRCLISRLEEPNIAHLYVIESDQNFLNNIRVLCTKHPETVRFFVPEELFLSIRNGESVAMTVECYDEYGRRRFTVDPLKVLSEQIREAEPFAEEGEELDFRLRIEGYELPGPEEGPTDFLTRPAMYDRVWGETQAAGANRGSYAGAAGSRAGSGRGSAYGSRAGSGRGNAYGSRAGSGFGTASGGGFGGSKGGASGRNDEPLVDPSFRRRKRFPFRPVILVLALLSAVAGIWLIRDTSVKRLGERMEMRRYSEAVVIYNEEIYGHEYREEKADPLVRLNIEGIRDDYIYEQYSYEDACAELNILTGIEKRELSEEAKEALEEVELYKASAATLQEGKALMEQGDYRGAIELYLQIGESSPVYKEAQDDLEDCVSLLIESAGRSESEEEWLEAIERIDAVLELLPENEELVRCRDDFQSKYQVLVRDNAVTEAEKLAKEKDYKGALARIEEGLEILPEDEELNAKAEALKKDFAREMIREAVAKVNEGNFGEAAAIAEEATEVYPCEELKALSEQIEEGLNGAEKEALEFEADGVTYIEYKGTLSESAQKVEHTVRATEGGACVFVLSGMESDMAVQFLIQGPDGTALIKEAGLTNGKEVNCILEQGKVFTVQLELTAGEGNYNLRFGQQKEAVDISDYDLVTDSTEFENQCNLYYYKPEENGEIRFDMTSEVQGVALRVRICDPMGGELFNGYMTDGGGVTVSMSAGNKYTIEALQTGTTGAYAISIGRPEPPQDITGKYIVPGEIRYEGQKKAYTFTAAESGQYLLTLANMQGDPVFKFYIYNQMGDKLAGTNSLRNGESVSVELTEGKDYRIVMTQQMGLGDYTLTIVKE